MEIAIGDNLRGCADLRIRLIERSEQPPDTKEHWP